MRKIKTKSIPPPALRTREEAIDCLQEIARLTIEHKQDAASMDSEITRIQAKYSKGLDEKKAAIAAKTADIQAWAEGNRAEFGNVKSLDLTHGVVGFRTSPHAVTLRKGWNWKRVLEAIQDLRWRRFKRVKEDVDKEAILARRTRLKESTLARMGVEITQEEFFFIELKQTETETRLEAKQEAQ